MLMDSTPGVVLTGATGYTGRLVAHELQAAALPFLLTGRDAARLTRLADALGGAATAVVDVRAPETLGTVLRAGDVVINCAGPFSELGEPVVRAAIEAKAHYLDTTGEQAFMKRVLDRYHEAAKAAGVAVVNGMAFEYALGDCAAAIAAEGLTTPLRSLDVIYAWPAQAAASRGTRRSILRVLESRELVYEGGYWRARRIGRERRLVVLPGGKQCTAVTFPAGEALTVPRHVEVERVRGWVVIGRTTAATLAMASPLLPVLARLARPLLELRLRRAPVGPDERERQAREFTILVEARGADGARRRLSLHGRDAYGLTAAIIVRGARRVLEPAGRPPPAGVMPPARLVEPRPFLDGLRDRGLELVR